MFPSASISQPTNSSTDISDEPERGWLKNASFVPVPDGVRTDTIEDGSSSTKHDDELSCPSDDEEKRKKERREKRKRKKEKKERKEKKEKKGKREKPDRPRLTSHDASKVFIEDVAGLQPEFAFRLDRAANLSILRFHSLAPAHVSRLPRPRHYPRAEEPLPASLQPCASPAGPPTPLARREAEERRAARRQRYFIASLSSRVSRARPVARRRAAEEDGDFLPLRAPPGPSGEAEGVEGAEGEEGEADDEREALNLRVREAPTDEEAWLRLARLPCASPGLATPEEEFARADAVLERALAANPASVRLRAARLEAAVEAWPAERLAAEWRRLVFLHPNRADAWRRYLRFLRRRGAGGQATASAAASQACATLRDVLAGRLCSHPAPPGADAELMDILAEHCRFLAEAGLAERALAAWQLALEVNLCPHADEEQRERWETFWESPEPKVGEPGARGFGRWRRQEEEEEEEEEALSRRMQRGAAAREDALLAAPRTRAEHWVALERQRDASQWLPLPPDEEVEDPDRIVLFEDVARVGMTRWGTPRMRQRLLLSALAFLGVESPEAAAALGLEVPEAASPPPELEERVTVVRQLIDAGREAFPGDDAWFCALTETQLEFELTLLAPLTPSARAKEVRRLGRSLLKAPAARAHCPLWRRYAEAEWQLGGGPDAARRVFDAALQHPAAALPCCDLAEPDADAAAALHPRLDLLAAYACLEWPGAAAGGSRDLMWRLLRLAVDAGAAAPSPAQLLRCGRALGLLQARLAALAAAAACPGAHDPPGRARDFLLRSAAAGATVLALLRCLLTEEGLAAGVDLLRAALGALRPGEGDPGAATLPYARLAVRGFEALRASATARCLSPAPARQVLREAAEATPDGPGPLLLLAEREGGAGRACGLAAPPGGRLGPAASPRQWLAAAEAEEERARRMAQAAGAGDGLVARVRAVYERAVASEKGRGCWQLWLRYLRFEALRKEKARGVFYRAIQQCPFAKPLLMEGAAVLPDCLQEVVDVLVEREMRLRTPLEELDLLLEAQDRRD